MNIKLKVAALGLAGVLALSGCTAVAAATDTASTTSTSSASASTTESDTTTTTTTQTDRGGDASTDSSSVSTESQLIARIEEAYGEADLGLHRGHQPIEDVLDDVLGITHEELHVRMEAGQNLSAIAEDLGVGTQTLIDALVDSASPAIDNLLTSGVITQAQADGYLAALEEAFTFRVTWDGEAATPSFEGIAA